MASKGEAAAVETNKRVDTRYPASAVPAITGMRLSPGDAVTLVNISASGVLVEGKTRFVPGTRVNVIFEGPVKPAQIKGRVVRCQVSSIGGGGVLNYQSAIAFEGRVELPVEESALPAAAAPVEEAPPPPPPSKKGKSAAAASAAAAAAPAPRPVYNRW